MYLKSHYRFPEVKICEDQLKNVGTYQTYFLTSYIGEVKETQSYCCLTVLRKQLQRLISRNT